MTGAFFIGLDSGRGFEPASLAVIERYLPEMGTAPARRRVWEYEVRHLFRFRPATPYPAIVEDIAELARQPEIHPAVEHRGDDGIIRVSPGQAPRLIVNASGPCRALFNMMADARLAAQLHPLTISDGAEGSEGRWGTTGDASYRAPRVQLVATLRVLLESGRLKFATGLALAEALKRELLNFNPSASHSPAHTHAGPSAYPETGGLVVAAAIAAWVAERPARTLQYGPTPLAGYRG